MSAATPEVPSIRVLIVKEQGLFAESLRLLLDSCPDVEVVGMAGTAAAGLAEMTRVSPDVVLLDCELPDADGLAALEEIKRADPGSQVVMLAGSGNERIALRAIESGCSGVLGWLQSVEQLLAVVRAAYAGDTLVIPSALLRLPPRTGRQCERLGADLSGRELQVLSAMSNGASDRAIAKELFISLNTARKHTHHIIQKLGVHSKLEAVVLAAREGLIRPL